MIRQTSTRNQDDEVHADASVTGCVARDGALPHSVPHSSSGHPRPIPRIICMDARLTRPGAPWWSSQLSVAKRSLSTAPLDVCCLLRHSEFTLDRHYTLRDWVAFIVAW